MITIQCELWKHIYYVLIQEQNLHDRLTVSISSPLSGLGCPCFAEDPAAVPPSFTSCLLF